MKLRFITEELGFESDTDTADFILNHGGQCGFIQADNEEVRLSVDKVRQIFEDASKVAFSKVDIKGQL